MILSGGGFSITGKFTAYASGTTPDTTGKFYPFGVHNGPNGIGLTGSQAFVRATSNAVANATIPAGPLMCRWRRDAANNCYYRGTNQVEILLGNHSDSISIQHIFAWFAQYNTAATTRYKSLLIAAQDLVTDYAADDAGIQAWYSLNDGVSL